MNKEEMIQFLKQNLSLESVFVNGSYEFSGDYFKVSLLLGADVISEIYLDLPNKN